MTRFLAILAAFALLWLVIERGLRAFRLSATGRQLSSFWRIASGLAGVAQKNRQPGRRQTSASAKLVRCRVCSTHVLEERCYRVEAGNPPGFYCSESCYRAEGAQAGA